MKRFLAVWYARNLEFLRDRSALAWNFLFPFLLVAGFAFAFSGDGKPLYKVGVLHDTPAARSAVALFAIKHIEFIPYAAEDAALTKLRNHQIELVIDLKTSHYFVNDSNQHGYMVERLLLGSSPERFEKATVTGRATRYVDWVLPGILGMNMMFSSLFGVGYVIVRYRKNGMLKRLKATPLTALEFLSAQVVSRLLLILAVTSIVFIGSSFIIDFQMKGSYLTLLLLASVGALSMISLGLLMAVRTASEEFAGGVLNLLSWPMMMLSGVWFSLEGALPLVQKVAQCLPLTHLIEGARAVMNEGAGLADIAPQLAILSAMSLTLLALSAYLFKWND